MHTLFPPPFGNVQTERSPFLLALTMRFSLSREKNNPSMTRAGRGREEVGKVRSEEFEKVRRGNTDPPRTAVNPGYKEPSASDIIGCSRPVSCIDLMRERGTTRSARTRNYVISRQPLTPSLMR